MMKMYESDDQVFVNAYAYDICILIGCLQEKTSRKGNLDWELQQRMKAVKKRIEKAIQDSNKNELRGANKSKYSSTLNGSKAMSTNPMSEDSEEQDEPEEEEEEEEEMDSFLAELEQDAGDKTGKNSTLSRRMSVKNPAAGKK